MTPLSSRMSAGDEWRWEGSYRVFGEPPDQLQLILHDDAGISGSVGSGGPLTCSSRSIAYNKALRAVKCRLVKPGKLLDRKSVVRERVYGDV